ncbi:hypothetical protein OGH69_11265 [Flavobacterium sp. MFBS3-15]|uniref:hypothetical protein n=1 Tax=Flavobacterium sp. MFBS3-15 TaxID=2989816 RepID=UPI002235884B|nr:hypothetical protein [Flavobacterium sp. MFBS3-15]MCW4469547.1 hypothetical protein [Flavobacterium sp. MFBS3-15]
MSKFLPFESIEYKTSLSKTEVFQRLQENVEMQKFSFFGNSYSKPYVGVVSDSSFRIKRVIWYRNSYLPEIKGEIFEHAESTRIKVTMKPVGFVIAFTIIWFGGTSLGCIAIALSGGFTMSFIVLFGMLLFMLAFVHGLFKIESKGSLQDLKEILKAEIV